MRDLAEIRSEFIGNEDLSETPAQHALQTVINGTFSVVFDTHAAAIYLSNTTRILVICV